MNRGDRFYLFITVFLVIAVLASGVMLAVKRSENRPVEIAPAQTTSLGQIGEVYIAGAVANPGIYPLQEDDTIETLLLDAGVEDDAGFSCVKIYIPQQGEKESPQKIDLNQAETWLLEALPGIGEVRAQAIVDYRDENGLFKRIEDLLQVKGIGQGTFDKIKDYITVSD